MKRRCREVQETLLDLHPSELDVHPRLTRHLDVCPDCRSFWEAWQDLGPALRASNLVEPVDHGRIAPAMAHANAARHAARVHPRPLTRDLVPALLLGSLILGLHVGSWILWGARGLAAVQAVSALLVPLTVLVAARFDAGLAGREEP